MRFLSLLTIALPVVLLPFQGRVDKATGAPRFRPNATAIPGRTSLLWDEIRSDASDRSNPGERGRTFVSNAKAANPLGGYFSEADPQSMLAGLHQRIPCGADETAGCHRDGWAETVENCHQGSAVIKGPVPEALDGARKINDLGVKAWDRGDLAQAERCHRQALEIRRRLAPRSLDLAESYNNLGSVEQQLGDLATAEKYEHSALAIRQALAPDSLAVAETLHSLGRVRMDRGDLAGAEQYLQRSLNIRLKLAPGSRDLALSLIGLANLSGRRGDVTRQEEYLHQALSLEGNLTPADLASIYQGLGGACLQRGNPEKAEEYIRQALEIREHVLPDSLPLAIS